MSGKPPTDWNLALYNAIKEKDVAKIRAIFKEGKAKNTEIMNISGFKPLELLFMPNKRYKTAPHTPLTFACRETNLEVVKALLDLGLNVNIPNIDDDTPLMNAAFVGKEDICMELLGRPDIDINLKNAKGDTALNFACYSGLVEVGKILINKTTDISIPNKKGYTALMWASMNEKSLELVKILVGEYNEKGYDANNKSIGNNEFGNNTALILALNKSHEDIALELLKLKGIDVNIMNNLQCSALIYAASMNLTRVVTELLKRPGIQVNALSVSGSSPLMLAIERGARDTPLLLIEHPDIDITIVSKRQETVLTIADRIKDVKNRQDILSALAKKIKDPDSQFIIALYNSQEILAKALLQNGVNPFVADHRHGGPLFMASQRGYTDIVTDILSKPFQPFDVKRIKGDGTERNKLKRISTLKEYVNMQLLITKTTALIAASYNGHTEVVKALLANGAEPRLKNSFGNAACDIARTPEIKDLVCERYRGYEKSSLEMLNIIFVDNKNAIATSGSRNSGGDRAHIVDVSFCPICLTIVERSEACPYMSHLCIVERRNEELFKKYSYKRYNGEMIVMWCTCCGRPANDHVHYLLPEKDNENKPPELYKYSQAPPFPEEPRFPDNIYDCRRSSGGGGVIEKMKRVINLINTVCQFQSKIDNPGVIDKKIRDDIIYEVWKLTHTTDTANDDKAKDYVKTALGLNDHMNPPPAKQFNFPEGCDFSKTKKPGQDEYYPDIERPEDEDHLAPEIHKHTEDEEAVCAVELGEHPDKRPVWQFKHKRPDGTINEHKGEYICAEDLQNAIKGEREKQNFCFCPIDPINCKAKLYPEELNGILSSEEYEEYKLLFNKNCGQRGGGGLPLLVRGKPEELIPDIPCKASAPKAAGKRTRTIRKKNKRKSMRSSFHK